MKTVRAFLFAALGCCCLLAFPVRFFGQSEGGDPAGVCNKLLSGVEEQIIGVAEAMPADKYNFAPTQGEFKGVRTFGQQLKHVAEANYGFFHAWNVPGAVSRADIEKLNSKEEIVKALRDSFTYAHSAINTIDSSNALEPVSPVDGQTTRAGIAAFSAVHVMDHYGQLVVYLRMNGIVPPSSR